VRRCLHIAVSYLCLFVGLGARYALAKEPMRDVDLCQLYRDMNTQYFQGKLQRNVPVLWGNPGAGNDAVTYTFKNGGTEIVIDHRAVTSEQRLHHIIAHEMCHVATQRAAYAAAEDVHGQAWQSCMKRFR